MRRNVQPLCQNTSVIACLIQHIDEIRVFEDVGNLRGTKQVFDILSNTGRQAAPFTEGQSIFSAALVDNIFSFNKQNL